MPCMGWLRSAGLRHRRSCLVVVVGDTPKEHGSLADPLRFCKPGLPQQVEDAAFGVVFQAVTGMTPAGQETVPAGLGASEIKQMKRTAGLQDAPDLTQGLLLVPWLEVMQHEGRKHAIEGCLPIRKCIRKPLIELDGDPGSVRLAYSSGERLRVGIERSDV